MFMKSIPIRLADQTPSYARHLPLKCGLVNERWKALKNIKHHSG